MSGCGERRGVRSKPVVAVDISALAARRNDFKRIADFCSVDPILYLAADSLLTSYHPNFILTASKSKFLSII
jgi:hypothetical protein